MKREREYFVLVHALPGILIALVICLAFAYPAAAKGKDARKEKSAESHITQALPPCAIRLNMPDAKPELAYTDAFLRSIMIKQLDDNIRFEFTHSGFNWKMTW